MRFDLTRLLGPLVAAILLVLILQQTVGALRAAGVWGHRVAAAAPADNPFAGIESLLAPAAGDGARPTRDPFSFGRAPEPVAAVRRRVAPRPVAPVAPPRPVLTSIVWLENNPSATIRWNGHDYPVQVNTLFDDFRVQSIDRNQVTLAHGGETLVLQLPKKGD